MSLRDLHPPPMPASANPDAQRERDRLHCMVESLCDVLSSHLSTEALLERAVEQAMAMTGASGAVVELVDGDELEYVSTCGSALPHRGLRLQRDHSLSGLAVEQRALQYARDIREDRRVDRAACERVGARSMMVMPLFHGGLALGVLKVVSPEPGAFDQTDEYALRLSAGLVGGVIGHQLILDENRRLLEDRGAALAQAATVLEASPAAIIVHDLDGTVRLWNGAAEALLGWSAADVVGRAPPHVDDEDRVRFDEFSRRVAAEGAASEIGRRRRRDGTAIDVRVSGAPLRDGQGRVTGIVRTLEDVSTQRAHADALRAAADRLRAVTDQSHRAFASSNATGRVIEWNPAAERMFGWTRAEALMRRFDELILPEASSHREALRAALEDGRGLPGARRVELLACHRDGSPVRVELSISAATVEGGPVFDAFIDDISARAPAGPAHVPLRLDALTGLPNHAACHARIEAALERSGRAPGGIALAIVNLDGFRSINDLFGQANGDAVLQEAARRLAGAVRGNDTVARLRADEFAILAEGLRDAPSDVDAIMAKVAAALDEPATIRGMPLPMQASCGVALHESTDDSADTLVQRARDAVARAKHAGGRRVEVAATAQPGLFDAARPPGA